MCPLRSANFHLYNIIKSRDKLTFPLTKSLLSFLLYFSLRSIHFLTANCSRLYNGVMFDIYINIFLIILNYPPIVIFMLIVVSIPTSS